MSVRSAKTQISQGIRPVWSESLLSAWRKIGSLATHWAHSEVGGCPGWSESSLSAHSFCWFCHVAAHFLLLRFNIGQGKLHLLITSIWCPNKWSQTCRTVPKQVEVRSSGYSKTCICILNQIPNSTVKLSGEWLQSEILPEHVLIWYRGIHRNEQNVAKFWAFAGRLCHKYHNLMSWLILCFSFERVIWKSHTDKVHVFEQCMKLRQRIQMT